MYAALLSNRQHRMIDLFNSYIIKENSAVSLISITYEPWLIALSYLIAVCTSILAFQLLKLTKDQSSNVSKSISILSSSFSLGAGIWAMHFNWHACTQHLHRG